MFRSLYSKLAAVLTGLFLVVGLIFVAVTVFSTEMYQRETNQKLNRGLAEQIVTHELLMKDSQVNERALGNVFHMLMVINPTIEIYLLDPTGKILAYSAPEGKVKRKSVDLTPVKKWLRGDMKMPLLGDDPRTLNRKKGFTAARITKNGKLEGYLYVILGGEHYDSVLQRVKGSYILRLSAWMTFTGLVFALVAGLIIFAMLTRRLKRLSATIGAFRGGSIDQPFELEPWKKGRFADEIDQLASTFNDMANRITTQMRELQRSEETRRELIANVSHDIRTPLATLRGYIETMLIKEADLSGSERRNYLEIAIDHCERLNKLVGQLLELARLDSCELSAHPEAFSMSELVQDVIQKFQLRAQEKQITIETSIEKGLPFAEADIGLIERVLENLLDNAIHYTSPEGSIHIVVNCESDDIIVQVADTGHGIENEELPHIFDRFYQLEKSRDTGGKHSGLGLAIAKKILELHERSIEVTSSVGSGTSFKFYLPVHGFS